MGPPACGDFMKLPIRIGADGNAEFKTFDCESAIASSLLGTEWVKRKTLNEAGESATGSIALFE